MMSRFLGVGVLVLLLAVMPTRAGDGYISDKDRDRHEEQAEKIRRQYEAQKLLKLKLEHIKAAEKFVIANLDVRNKPAGEVLAAIRQETERLDADGAGVNIAYACDAERLKTPITLQLRDVPLPDVLRYVGMAANLGFEYEAHAVVCKNREDAEMIDVRKLAAELLGHPTGG